MLTSQELLLLKSLIQKEINAEKNHKANVQADHSLSIKELNSKIKSIHSTMEMWRRLQNRLMESK